MDEATQQFQRLGISLLLGLLVGLQRERVRSAMAGFRSFALITLFGTTCGFLAQEFGGWVVAAGLLGMIAVIVMGNVRGLGSKARRRGVTTELAILAMYAIGVYVAVGSLLVAIAMAGAVAVLLQFKPQLHELARKLSDSDRTAIMTFVLISFIILPVLPNETYGPFQVLNPFQVWLMVVLIVGISLGGYIVYRFFGDQAGILFGGIVGGMISSTATTVSYARRSSDAPTIAPPAAVVIMIASVIVFVRVLLEISVVAPSFLHAAALPLATMMVVLGGLALVALVAYWQREDRPGMPEQENPTELKSAIVFGALYAGILLGVAATKEYLGPDWLYVIAAASGMTDMDAITLSVSQLVQVDRLDADHGWRMILVAALSNLCFKGAMVGVLGSTRLFLRIALLYGLALLAGGVILAFL